MTNLLNPLIRPLLRRLYGGRAVFILAAACLFWLVSALPAAAQCSGRCHSGCVTRNHSNTRELIIAQHNLTRLHMTQEMRQHQRWWFNEFFNQYILPAEMMMATQLSAVGMKQMEMVGAMWDAKHQLESQALFQELTAEAHKDYHSSHGMCTFATAARGLAASDRRAEVTAQILGRRSQNRQLGHANVSAADGAVIDKGDRLAQFIRRYCDPNDSNSGQRAMCESGAPTITINKDVDYNRLIETPLTLDIDFTEGEGAEGDEEDVMAFASNLFSHDVFYRLSESEAAILANNEIYFDLRSVVAKRSVAEHSFYSIIGMKARGSAESEEAAGFIGVILEQLGVPDDEIFVMLGERPSYYALMDMLAQKIYQRPEFYTDLYDKPANVLRKDVAIQAIDLMVDRDIYKSDLRTEAMLSVLLEVELMKRQRHIQRELNVLPQARRRAQPAGGAP